MNYQVKAHSESAGKAEIIAKNSQYVFGINADQTELAGPAEILLSSFAACCLKNVERFSTILHYTYKSADIEVIGERQEKPPMFTKIDFKLNINTDQPNFNAELLLKNLRKFGTVYNTLSGVCEITGHISVNTQ
jgi:uncharacterized OsmC-like protein